MTVTLASFQFGYNISAMNSPTDILKEFISENSFLFQGMNRSLNVNKSTGSFQSTEKVDYIWTLINCLFVVGGMIGAFMSKSILDVLGRKGGILFHYIFSLSGSILVLISFYSSFPNLLIISRFLFGVQGGMSCSLIPTYLSEISPASLRGQTGVAHQLCLTIGILIAQILGFKEILGNQNTWHFLLAFPLIPSLIGTVLLTFFFPETPKALINYRKTEQAEKALIKLRNRTNVNSELQEIFKETSSDTAKVQIISFGQLLTESRFRWSLITALALQIAQQLCGINAVFFYSERIFKNAEIGLDSIQYAIFLTGLINFLSTILCTFLIDKLGRRPLLIYPMFLIVIDFIALTVFLNLVNLINFFLFIYLKIVSEKSNIFHFEYSLYNGVYSLFCSWLGTYSVHICGRMLRSGCSGRCSRHVYVHQLGCQFFAHSSVSNNGRIIGRICVYCFLHYSSSLTCCHHKKSARNQR